MPSFKNRKLGSGLRVICSILVPYQSHNLKNGSLCPVFSILDVDMDTIIQNHQHIQVQLVHRPALWCYSKLNELNFLFSQKLIKLSPLLGFEPVLVAAVLPLSYDDFLQQYYILHFFSFFKTNFRRLNHTSFEFFFFFRKPNFFFVLFFCFFSENQILNFSKGFLF